MSNIQVGNIVHLTVKKKLPNGYMLTDDTSDIFLDTKESDDTYNEGDKIEVFLYHDDKRKIAATTQIPNVRFSTFDWAEVVEVNKNLGVFVNIGTSKDVLVSLDDLPQYSSAWPIVGDQLYVTLKLDKKNRLLADPVREVDFEDNWDQAPESLFNQDIKGRVFRSGKEGAVMISEEGYRGFIHHSQRKREPRVGEWIEGRVIKVKQDGTLNVSLLPRKKEAQSFDADRIMTYLKQNDGEMPFDNQSDPDDIRTIFQMSKAAFKRAIGKLYKERRIKQEAGKTILTDDHEEV
ncbi:CvfB family protein [Amphibacillus sp. Q70]|uniref:CvfB family protein n=1 Tax=Amphibacillus sp. Q70 TaxID=3453416 RepID=UPI003F86E703